ncbi:MAG: hypothetical protein ACE5LV_00950 [Candidatus Aminicenantales bacterium]
MESPKAPFQATRAAFGCSVGLIFMVGGLGLVVSFFVKDPVLATEIRKRCLLGLAAGAGLMVLWQFIKTRLE